MIALLLSLALQAPAPPAPAPDFAALEEVARAELAETGTPGAAIAVIQGGRAVYGKGLGVANVETGAPVTPTTLFHIGSLTKLLTAAAIVSEAEAGRLRLDQPVGEIVPGLAPKLSRLTLHQLLAQTSGLKETPGEDGLHGEEALAGLALEAATGKPYAEAMERTLFQPMGMLRTTLRSAAATTQPPGSAGSAFSNLEDLARFVIALLNRGRVNGRQGMPPGVAGKLLASQDDRGLRRAELGGYGAEIRLFPEKRVGVIVLVNREGVRLNKTFDKAFDLFVGPAMAASSSAASAPGCP